MLMSINGTLTHKTMVSSISENTSLNKMDKCISPRINSYVVPIFVASKGAIFCSVKYSKGNLNYTYWEWRWPPE